MKEFKLSVSFYVMMVFFAVAGLFAIKTGLTFILEPAELGSLFGYLFALIGALWFISSLTMLLQIVSYKGTGLKMDKEGIHDTLIFGTVLAFYFCFPIKFIPWEAVKAVNTKKGITYALVDAYKVQASIAGKVLVKLFGYGFGGNFVKPRVTQEDIKKYVKAAK